MNAERLHAIVNSLGSEVAATKESLNALTDAVRGSANNPGDRDFEARIGERRDELNRSLTRAPSELLPPAGREALKELKVTGLLGSGLRRRVDDIVKRNAITPALAAEALDELGGEVERLSELLRNMETGFEQLGIGFEELKPGEVEVSFLIPRRDVHNGLEELGREFINIRKIFGPFQELTGAREEVRVRAIASSEFEAFLFLVPIVAANFAKALETVLNIYEKILNIRRASKQLEATGVDQRVVDALEEQATIITKREIKQFVEELLNERSETDDSDRERELGIDLEKQTLELAKRIDLGYTVDLDGRELAPADDKGEPPRRAEERAAVQDVLAARDRLRTFKLTGRPVLGLPASTDGDAEDDGEAYGD